MFGLNRKLFDKIKSKSKNIRIHGHQIQCFTSIICCQLTNVKSTKSNTLLSSMCVCWHSMHCNMKQIVSWNYRNCLFLLFLSNRKHQIKILIACQFLYFLEKKKKLRIFENLCSRRAIVYFLSYMVYGYFFGHVILSSLYEDHLKACDQYGCEYKIFLVAK